MNIIIRQRQRDAWSRVFRSLTCFANSCHKAMVRRHVRQQIGEPMVGGCAEMVFFFLFVTRVPAELGSLLDRKRKTQHNR